MAINDVTYLLDESLQLLKKIHDIETDIDNKEEWEATPMVSIIRQKEEFYYEIFSFSIGNTDE
jgi:cell division septum initiation protein DivIVA